MNYPNFEARLIGCSNAFEHGYFDPEDARLMQEFTDNRNYVALLSCVGEHVEIIWDIEVDNVQQKQEREPMLEMTESCESFVATNNTPVNCPGRRETGKRNVADFFEFDSCFGCDKSLIFDGYGNRI